MSKLSLFAQIKTFIASHLVPVIISSTVVVTGITAGVVAIVINSSSEQNVSDAGNPISEQENSNEPEDTKNNDSNNSDNSDTQISEDNVSSDTQKPTETSKPATSSNQTTNNQPSQSQSTTKPNSSSSTQTPAQPTQPSQPTQPQTPTKTEYFYVCKGTISDPAKKAQMLAEFPGADDYITLTLNGPYRITDCWEEFKNSTMVDPNYTKYFTWQLIECNSFEEMDSYLTR